MPCPAPLFGNVGVDISLAPRRESNYKDHLSPSATYIQAYSSLADSYRQRIGYWAMIPAPMPLQKSAVSRQARIYFQPLHEATKCLEYIFRGVGRRLSLTAGKPQVSMYGRELTGMPAVICAAAQHSCMFPGKHALTVGTVHGYKIGPATSRLFSLGELVRCATAFRTDGAKGGKHP